MPTKLESRLAALEAATTPEPVTFRLVLCDDAAGTCTLRPGEVCLQSECPARRRDGPASQDDAGNAF